MVETRSAKRARRATSITLNWNQAHEKVVHAMMTEITTDSDAWSLTLELYKLLLDIAISDSALTRAFGELRFGCEVLEPRDWFSWLSRLAGGMGSKAVGEAMLIPAKDWATFNKISSAAAAVAQNI